MKQQWQYQLSILCYRLILVLNLGSQVLVCDDSMPLHVIGLYYSRATTPFAVRVLLQVVLSLTGVFTCPDTCAQPTYRLL